MSARSLVVVLLACVVLIAACVPGSDRSAEGSPAGFFWGVWHGWIAPFSLVLGLFSHGKIRIYEKNNTGWFYDLGYYAALVGGFGGLALVRRRRAPKDAD